LSCARRCAWVIPGCGASDTEAIDECDGAVYQLSVLPWTGDSMFSRDNAGPLQLMNTVVAGALTGVVTVYVTMPFDTIKTRLQALDGHELYRGSWDCLRSVIRSKSVFALWREATPRLARLSVGPSLMHD